MLRNLTFKATKRSTGLSTGLTVAKAGRIPPSFTRHASSESEPQKPTSGPASRASLWILAAATVVLIADGYIWSQNGFKSSLTSGWTNSSSTRQSSSTPSSSSLASSYTNTDHDRYASPSEVQQAIAKLRTLLPSEDAVATDPDELQSYGSSENSYHPTSPHAVVVRPKSTEDVVKIVNVAREYRVPITAYSGATSLEGHFAGVSAISFSLGRMWGGSRYADASVTPVWVV